VFWERGGFDLIAGNPPWVSIELDEGGILSEKSPEISIRNVSAPIAKKMGETILSLDVKLKQIYVEEFIWAESTKVFLSSSVN
jgi:hypothetical protein